MDPAQFSPVGFLGAFAIFAAIAAAMLLAPLLLGWLVRPRVSNPEKDAVYECGEPTMQMLPPSRWARIWRPAQRVR